MPRAEVIWNGIAKSYRVGGELFQQNRARTEDWPKDLYDYLKSTRGFTVIDKFRAAPAKAPQVPQVVASQSTAPAQQDGPSDAEGAAEGSDNGSSDDDDDLGGSNGPRRRIRR